jgi:hypothetical protein
MRWAGIGYWMFDFQHRNSPPSRLYRATSVLSLVEGQVIGEDKINRPFTFLPIDLRWGGGRPQA